MKKRILLAVSLVCATGSFVFAQKAAAPPPQPADNGPSLAVTMQFIQEKLASTGMLTYVLNLQDTRTGATGNQTVIREISNVVANPNTCSISNHLRFSGDGKDYTEQDSLLSLRDFQSVAIKPFDQYESTELLRSGAGMTVTSTSPVMVALVVMNKHGEYNSYFFIDADLAARVAKALSHAAELCGSGGGGKEPF